MPPVYPVCGAPFVQNCAYVLLQKGEFTGAVNVTRVVDVIDAQTVVVRFGDGTEKTVSLTEIDARNLGPQERQAAQAFPSSLRGSRVDVLIHHYAIEELDRSAALEARVSCHDTGRDLAVSLLDAGLAEYSESEYLCSFDNCVYKAAADGAKAAGRGHWGR